MEVEKIEIGRVVEVEVGIGTGLGVEVEVEVGIGIGVGVKEELGVQGKGSQLRPQTTGRRQTIEYLLLVV